MEPGASATIQWSLAVPHLQSRLDLIADKLERNLEAQEQIVTVQTQMLQCLQRLADQVSADAADTSVDTTAMDLLPKRFYEGGSPAERKWFKAHLTAIFDLRPDSFDTDSRKRAFAVLSMSLGARDDYSFWLRENNLQNTWDSVKRFLRW
ncbi:hypothetical protein OC846_006382 [Tilletia horrida]|uniref:Uncharacterized protein n=1 Tax=Tilletia horrida TaxID=155126 RepID=A0AAN6JNP9_9BASI|nr:hypothetical protein OC846_006382 [Tilletia horrida]KAK0559927.1 hypothetical protein OC861_006470 [Tilletia horrida]